eukprot:scaffold193391_cov32-Tisochrysis_lutea.AAC.1
MGRRSPIGGGGTLSRAIRGGRVNPAWCCTVAVHEASGTGARAHRHWGSSGWTQTWPCAPLTSATGGADERACDSTYPADAYAADGIAGARLARGWCGRPFGAMRHRDLARGARVSGPSAGGACTGLLLTGCVGERKQHSRVGGLKAARKMLLCWLDMRNVRHRDPAAARSGVAEGARPNSALCGGLSAGSGSSERRIAHPAAPWRLGGASHGRGVGRESARPQGKAGRGGGGAGGEERA